MCRNLLGLRVTKMSSSKSTANEQSEALSAGGGKKRAAYPRARLTFWLRADWGASAGDLLRDVDSWAHSAGRWVSDTGMRLWNRSGVIPGHLHTASISIGSGRPPSPPTLPPLAPPLSAHLPGSGSHFILLLFLLPRHPPSPLSVQLYISILLLFYSIPLLLYSTSYYISSGLYATVHLYSNFCISILFCPEYLHLILLDLKWRYITLMDLTDSLFLG